MSNLASKLGQIAPKQIRDFSDHFRTFWLGEKKCTETDLKKFLFCPIWGQNTPNLDAKWTSLLWSNKYVSRLAQI